MTRISIFYLVLAVAFVAAALAVASPAFAAVQQAQPDPQGEWQPVKGDSAAVERLPATPFVLYAYGFVWVATLGYLWTIWRRLNRVRQDLASLERRVTRGSTGR